MHFTLNAIAAQVILLKCSSGYWSISVCVSYLQDKLQTMLGIFWMPHKPFHRLLYGFGCLFAPRLVTLRCPCIPFPSHSSSSLRALCSPSFETPFTQRLPLNLVLIPEGWILHFLLGAPYVLLDLLHLFQELTLKALYLFTGLSPH